MTKTEKLDKVFHEFIRLRENAANSKGPILMVEEYWANSQLSIARYYGGISFNGAEYKIVNKEGITLQELSDPRSKHYVKEGKAIAPGEPADLVRVDWIPIYKKVGRERVIEMARSEMTLDEAQKEAKRDEQKGEVR